ncbi:methionine aminopeptidase [Cytobacillus firmus]|jgi:DnaJ-class molecular chaperone|uniref:Methionine aminopeptidase n=2 Tax=Cytobacillus firmus TaxID=1399 RepID=W7KV11_CYTFI|nr:methionine aminopeptidase [Cytobacillus firmus]EWG11310.1 hypothetical protein PBF_09807 [Cytobacillus firmus DS1]USK37378.1 methionine aminopeptidase [Cytobacillus firmus]
MAEVKKMGLLNAFNEWREMRYQNHVNRMKEENKCPDCYGRGFSLYPGNEFAYHANQFDCQGCNGTGLYSEWNSLS